MKISNCGEHFEFQQKFIISMKIPNFGESCEFRTKLRILGKHFEILLKIPNFGKNCEFRKKLKFQWNIWISEKILNFGKKWYGKFRVVVKISDLDENFELRSKFRISKKNFNFWEIFVGFQIHLGTWPFYLGRRY